MNLSNQWKKIFDKKLASSSGQGLSGFGYLVCVASASTKQLSNKIKALVTKETKKLKKW